MSAPQKQMDDDFVPLYRDSLHDLASPVNQICTLFDLYRRRQRQQAHGEEDVVLNLIHVSAARLQTLIAALNDYARMTGGPCERRSCEGAVLVAGALGSLDAAIRESGAQVTHEPLPSLFCDPSQVMYAFTSLIDNAIKFRGKAPPEVRISAAERGRDWLIAVRDNGMGIEPRRRESVFHMFSRIHGDQYPGAGGGLAIARRIVEAHGGAIWVESEPGQGSTFYFTIPRG